MPRLCVHLLPALVKPEELADGTVVVIDVLRATTTITAALAAGCREVVPCLDIDDARRTAREYTRGQAVLGGERDGLRIDGFDLGNSPAEYTAAAVSGKSIVFTTTNGTRAMLAGRLARRILIAAFTNLTAVCRRLAEPTAGGATATGAAASRTAAWADVHLLCAGTQGHITREDALLAGAIAARLILAAPDAWEVDDQARLAADSWICVAGSVTGSCGAIDPAELAHELRQTHGGRNLTAIDLDRDIVDAAAVDRYDRIGELRIDGWRIA